MKSTLALSFLVAAVVLCHGGTLPKAAEISRLVSLIKFNLYTSTSHRDPVLLSVANTVELSSEKVTVILIHGYYGHQFEGPSIFNTVLKDAFFTNDKEPADVIAMDWSIFNTFDYASTVSLLPDVATALKRFIDSLKNEKDAVPLSNIHLVGFDLGAHLAGMTARLYSDDKIARITGLDPAASGWSNNEDCLKSTDANYVEVIHTDTVGATALGLVDAMGHVDFYPNGGTKQTGCSTNLCNHDRAWELFASTLTHRNHFGNRCENMAQVTANTCVLWPSFAMGTNELNKIVYNGIYRINTSRNLYPYEAIPSN